MSVPFQTEREVELGFLEPLFREVLGYPADELEWAKPVDVALGTQTRTEAAGLVAHYAGEPVITVEAKRSTEPVRNHLGRVDSYAAALRTPYSIITNGEHFVLRGYFSLTSRINVLDESVDELQHESWQRVKRLISFENIPGAKAEQANDVAAPDATKIQDYRRFFRKIHNEIRDRDKLDPGAAFDELSKLLFLKAAEDEWRQHAPGRQVLTPEKITEWEALGAGKAQEFVNAWFRDAVAELFPGVFEEQPRINLSAGTLREVLTKMRPFHVKGGDVDVKGRAFEEFLPSQLRGKGLGQFFTPRPIVNVMAGLADVSIQDVVVDFSCGSGGFLIKAFEQMQLGVELLPSATIERLGTTRGAMLDHVKSRQIFGVDAEPRAARTAKMNMLMWGDGRQIVRGNALDVRDAAGQPYAPAEYTDADPESGCTLILANPPFGSREKDQAILRRYTLAGRGPQRKPARTEVLFIEKGLKLLRPEGRMLIVLPQGLMSNSSMDRVRDYIHSIAEVRAVISLPTHTFVQSGVPTVNTCILYLQKFATEKKRLYDERAAGRSVHEIRQLLRTDPAFDYPIFMGTAEYVGFGPSGRPLGKPGEDTDLDLLLEDFTNQAAISRPDVDVFAYAAEHYGDRSSRRKDQVVRGTTRGLKTSFVVRLRDTEERLDPPFYLLHVQAGRLLDALTPLGTTITEHKRTFRPRTEEQLDADYPVLTVSSDGAITLNQRMRGEEFRAMKRVCARDVVYNPMRINVGSVGVVPAEFDGGLVSPDYIVFRSEAASPEFLVALLRSPVYRMYADVVSTGSIRDRLYFRDLQSMRMPQLTATEEAAAVDAMRRADGHARELLAQLAVERQGVIRRLDDYVRTAAVEAEDAAQLPERFAALARRWHRETGMSSSLGKKVRHPAYQQIIAMGARAVPLIMRDLRTQPGYWFPALEAITGASPTADGEATDLRRARQAWLDWAEAEGYE